MEGLDNHKIFVPPKAIILKNYTYKFKEELVNQNFIYRCQNRFSLWFSNSYIQRKS